MNLSLSTRPVWLRIIGPFSMRLNFLLFCLFLSSYAWGQVTTPVESYEGIKIIRNGAGIVSFSGVTSKVASTVVVPATATFDEYGELDITLWRENCLNASDQEISPNHIVSIKSEDSNTDSQLKIEGNSISGWTELKSIELPTQLSAVDCDFVNNCPKLESITFRSPKVIEFDSELVTTNVTLAAKPVLYVQPDLVDEYQKLKETSTGNAGYFLSQCSYIVPIGTELPPRGVHILMGDLHLNMVDAKPGDKVTISAPNGETIKDVTVNGESLSTAPGTAQTEVTLPDFDHHMVMAVNLSSGMSGCSNPVADRADGLRVSTDGVSIDNYDGSMVHILDLTGRIVAQGHRSTFTLSKGIYILLYAGNGHKISIK